MQTSYFSWLDLRSLPPIISGDKMNKGEREEIISTQILRQQDLKHKVIHNIEDWDVWKFSLCVCMLVREVVCVCVREREIISIPLSEKLAENKEKS